MLSSSQGFASPRSLLDKTPPPPAHTPLPYSSVLLLGLYAHPLHLTAVCIKGTGREEGGAARVKLWARRDSGCDRGVDQAGGGGRWEYQCLGWVGDPCGVGSRL